VADRITGVYAEPQKIAEVDINGKYFRCRARHFVAVKLFYDVQPIIGRTEAEAREKAQYLASLPRPEASLATLSGQLGVDFSRFDWATPLQDVAVPGIQGVKDAHGGRPAGALHGRGRRRRLHAVGNLHPGVFRGVRRPGGAGVAATPPL
jgi:hypothetical protein